MVLRIIRKLFFFSTLQVIYTVLYYTILFYTILYSATYIYIYIYVSILYTINIVYIYIYIYIYIYSICTPPQYLTRVDIETIREYLEARSDKSISSNSLCDLASFILKNNYFENEELKYHQKRGFAIGTKFAPPYSNLFMAGL